MASTAIFDSIRAAELAPPSPYLELCRREVQVAPGVRLSLLDVTPEQSTQTLVLVHGFGASNAWWQHQIEPLARHQRVIAVDLRGHGRSDRPPDGYTIAQQVDDVAAVLQALAVRGPVVLAGHSMGGFVVTDLALHAPDLVSRLVLIATPVAIRRRWLPVYARFLMHYPDWLLRLLQPIYEQDPQGRGTADLLALKQLFDDMLHWDGERRFPRLPQPVLVLVGDRDLAFPESAYSRVAELIPHAERIDIGVSKHQVPLERPKAVLRAIERFAAPSDDAPFLPSWRAENDNVDSIRLLTERPWVARYEGHVPHTLHAPHVPVTRLLEQAARAAAARPAIHYRGWTIAYQRLAADSQRLAGALQALGVERGARVLLLLPNGPHWVAAFYGVLRCRAVVVPLDPRQELAEVARQARETGATLLIAHESQAAAAAALRAQGAVSHVIYARETDYVPSEAQRSATGGTPTSTLPGLEWDTQHDHLWPVLLAAAPPIAPADDVDSAAPAVILFTPGTAGTPKAVRLSQYNLLASALQAAEWLSSIRARRPAILCALPFHHAAGLTLGVNLAVRLAACIEIPSGLESPALLVHVRRRRPTLLLLTPAQILAINEQLERHGALAGQVQLCISTTAPLPVEVKESFERLSKVKLIEGYGLSETAGLTHLNPLHEPRTGSVGLPLPGCEARILSLVDGQPLGSARPGELAVRGPQVMSGYWPDGGGLDEQGWLHTGDVASMDDDGYFQLFGRRQDIWFDATGEPLLARDVEEVLYELPEVREAAVVISEGRPLALLALHAGEELDAAAVEEFCRRRLPPSHQPAKVRFVPALPRNLLGKVLKKRAVGNGPTSEKSATE